MNGGSKPANGKVPSRSETPPAVDPILKSPPEVVPVDAAAAAAALPVFCSSANEFSDEEAVRFILAAAASPAAAATACDWMNEGAFRRANGFNSIRLVRLGSKLDVGSADDDKTEVLESMLADCDAEVDATPPGCDWKS